MDDPVRRRDAVLADRLHAIHAAPEGPTTTAYVDYDGTLIAGFSAVAFYRHRIRSGRIGPLELARTLAATVNATATVDRFEKLLDVSVAGLAGATPEQLRRVGARVFDNQIAETIRREVWDLCRAHQERGHRVVIATSATRMQVQDMAETLGVDALLCTEVEVDAEGRLTGQVAGRSPYGPFKAAAVREDAAAHGVDLDASFAYSNGREDVRFLATVGHPMAVSPDRELREVAEARGWPVLDCQEQPGPVPGVRRVARTAGFYGGLVGGLATGLGLGALNRDRRQAIDLAVGFAGDASLAAAGVHVEIEGIEHLRRTRPCVAVFNHQSTFDVPVLMKVLRGGFTGVAKKEVARMPIWGQFFRFADVAFIDRTDRQQALKALEPAVRLIRDKGISVAIAPEGTISPTPDPLPFKKGAFHLAIQAGVPMVPIVLRNTGNLAGSSAIAVNPGTVQVRVLPPVDTSGWSAEELDGPVEQVRDLFIRTLRDWPTTSAS
ncbi:HAD-IB family hydrolase [Nocardioidaceae bacterium]|nr:HAD-IB family hydrolase [Nocardioidaceae bacterium]